MKPDFGYFEEKKLGKPYDLKLLKRLYPFTRPYRLPLLGSIVLVLLITVLDLALPYVTKVAIDREQGSHAESLHLRLAQDPDLDVLVLACQLSGALGEIGGSADVCGQVAEISRQLDAVGDSDSVAHTFFRAALLSL